MEKGDSSLFSEQPRESDLQAQLGSRGYLLDPSAVFDRTNGITQICYFDDEATNHLADIVTAVKSVRPNSAGGLTILRTWTRRIGMHAAVRGWVPVFLCLALSGLAEAGPKVFPVPVTGMERLGEADGNIYLVGDGIYRFGAREFEPVVASLEPLPEDDRHRIASVSKRGGGSLVLGGISWGSAPRGGSAGVLYTAENRFRPINIAPADQPALASAIHGVSSTPERIVAVGTVAGTRPLVWDSIRGLSTVDSFPLGVCCTIDGDSRFLSVSSDGSIAAGFTDPPHTGDIDPTVAVKYSVGRQMSAVLGPVVAPSSSRSMAFHVSSRGEYILGLTADGLTRWDSNNAPFIIEPNSDQLVEGGLVMDSGDVLFPHRDGAWMFYDARSGRVSPYAEQWRSDRADVPQGKEAGNFEVLAVRDAFEMSRWRVDLVETSAGTRLAFFPLRPGPDLTVVERLADGPMQLTAIGLPETGYLIEVAVEWGSPARWVALEVVSSDRRGVLRFIDRGALGHRARFYRFLRQ